MDCSSSVPIHRSWFFSIVKRAGRRTPLSTMAVVILGTFMEPLRGTEKASFLSSRMASRWFSLQYPMRIVSGEFFHQRSVDIHALPVWNADHPFVPGLRMKPLKCIQIKLNRHIAASFTENMIWMQRASSVCIIPNESKRDKLYDL